MPVRAPFLPDVSEAIRAVDPAAQPQRSTRLGEGYGTVAYRVPSSAGDWAVRLPKPRSHWALGDLEREARLLPLIARQPFEVAVPREPTLLRAAEGGTPSGTRSTTLGVAHRLVPGTPLSQAGAPRGRARIALCEAIGRFLGTLHATPARQAARHGAREVDLWASHYEPLIASSLAALGPAGARWLGARAEAFVAEGGTERAPRVLIHADLSGDHLLVDDRGALSGVIDFADALIADPALDFAGVLNHLGWRDLERVWAAYPGVIDADAERRVRFYIDVAPIFRIAYGEAAHGPHERAAGVREIAARASAATRRGPATGRIDGRSASRGVT
jgi:Ser/Thr protein kinase RdoA (MazF antagonist)